MFSSFGIVEISIDSVSEQYAPEFKVNEERVDILKEYCDVIDKFVEQNDTDSFEVDIDDTDKTIHIALGVSEFVEEDPRLSMFVELIAHAMSFGIEWVDDEKVIIRFVFPSVWEKVSE